MEFSNNSLLMEKNVTGTLITSSNINATVSCQVTQYDENEKIIMRVYLVIVFVFAALGNAVTCCILGKKKFQRGGDVFVLSLALSDLIYTISFPFIFFLRMSGIQIQHTVYTASKIFIYGSMVVTTYTHAVISCDRFWAIAKPFQARRITKGKKLLACSLVWLFGFLFSPLFLLQTAALTTRSQIVQLVRCCIGWVMPLVIMCVFYIRCAIALSARNVPSNSGANKRFKDARKITKMFFVIVLLYCILTMPIVMSLLVRAVDFLVSDFEGIRCGDYSLLMRVLTNLSVFNGCVNPIIYARNHPDIRRFFKGVFEACFCQRQTNSLSFHKGTEIRSSSSKESKIQDD
ncbi:galanin receptor 2a-like [Rhopilema esculentum]|uniref:galanin receptor 2a-like n=1 Tax=Rhopilema esculentum TaxID=499914 RepID=UPI0031DB0BE3